MTLTNFSSKAKREADAAVIPFSSTTTAVPSAKKGNKCDNVRLDLLPENKKNKKSFNTSFVIYIATEEEVGGFKTKIDSLIHN